MFLRKYFGGDAQWRWLFGEVFVVIIGVLAALSIENVWSGRIDQQLELEYLIAIRTSVQADIDFVDNFYETGLPQKMNAIETIWPTVRNKAPFPDDLAVFFKNVQLAAIAGVAPNYVVQRVIFDDLTSTGNLRLIRDARIRRGITSYYATYDTQYNRTVARLTEYSNFVNGMFPSYLGHEMSLTTMQLFDVDRAMEAIMSDEFESLLYREENYGFFLQSTLTQFTDQGRAFQSELDLYIEQLDRN